MENRNGLVVGAMLTQANGHAEREAAKLMIRDARAANPEGEITLGADKGYDAGEFSQAADACHAYWLASPRRRMSR
jgi:hypothetical protein